MKTLLIWLLLCTAAYAATLPPLASCDPANPGVYDTNCIGQTVCFNATATSGIAIPYNQYRKYLLIQSESTVTAVYFAIGSNPAANPLVAQANVNTIQLAPLTPTPSNYEPSNGLNNTVPGMGRVPPGAVALVSGGGTVPVCILENNG
jgi:hypothetical protein